ncbi:MAG TPA: hypothetical protein VN213_13035, partial [Solirubrobacteraceae bacterium]|nr:hypothetical protein [Solirubrobacteraceae bacterium]
MIDWRHVNADSIGHHVIRPLRRDLAAIIGDHPRLGDALDLMHELTLDLFLVPPVHIAEQLRAQGIDATVRFAGDELKDKARELAAPAILVTMQDLEEPLRRHVDEATGPLF